MFLFSYFHTVIINIEKALENKINDSLFRQKKSKTQQDNGGFARRLFSELSSYTHGGPSFTNADIWQSNGPLFVRSAVKKWINVYSGVSALAILLAKAAQPNLNKFIDSELNIELFFKSMVEYIDAGEDGVSLFRSIPSEFWDN